MTRDFDTQQGAALWSSLLDAALDAIIAMDAEGRVVEFNAAAERIFGYRRDDVLGEVMADLMVPEHLRDAHRAGLERYLATGEPKVLDQRLEMTGLRSDGTTFPIELTVTRVPGVDPPMFSGQVRDITDRVEITRQVERRMRQQSAVAELGRHALSTTGIEGSAATAVKLAAEGLGAQDVHLFRLTPDESLQPVASHPGDSAPFAEWIEAVLMAGTRAPTVRVDGDNGDELLGAVVQGGDRTFGMIVARVHNQAYVEGDELFLESLANVLAASSDVAQALADLQMSREQLEVIFRNVGDAITVQDPSGRLVYANDAAAMLLGRETAADLLAAEPGDLADEFVLMDENREPLSPGELPGRRVLRDGVAVEADVRYRSRSTGTEGWSRIRSSPVLDESGEVVLAINIIQDISEQRQRAAGDALLARIGHVLGSSLDYESTLREVADLVVPSVADWAVIYLVDGDGYLQPVAVRHADDAKADLILELHGKHDYHLEDDLPASTVARTGQSVWLEEIDDELLELATEDPEELAMLRELGFRSSLIVPIRARGRAVGTLALAQADSGRTFGPGDLPLLEEVGRRAGTAIDNARLFSERAYIAETLQQSLLPPFLPEIEGVDLAASYYSGAAETDIGGDFYDVFRFDEQRWAAVIGDVQGKGVEAATLVGLARHTMRAAALTATTAKEVLHLLNSALLQHPTRRMCTAALVLVRATGDGAAATVTLAGHPFAIKLTADGPESVGAVGTVLGYFDDAVFKPETVDLGPGESLVLYSDGVAPKAEDPTEVMMGILREAKATTSSELVAAIEQRVMEAQPSGPHDDTTLIVLRPR